MTSAEWEDILLGFFGARNGDSEMIPVKTVPSLAGPNMLKIAE